MLKNRIDLKVHCLIHPKVHSQLTLKRPRPGPALAVCFGDRVARSLEVAIKESVDCVSITIPIPSSNFPLVPIPYQLSSKKVETTTNKQANNYGKQTQLPYKLTYFSLKSKSLCNNNTASNNQSKKLKKCWHFTLYHLDIITALISPLFY